MPQTPIPTDMKDFQINSVQLDIINLYAQMKTRKICTKVFPFFSFSFLQIKWCIQFVFHTAPFAITIENSPAVDRNFIFISVLGCIWRKVTICGKKPGMQYMVIHWIPFTAIFNNRSLVMSGAFSNYLVNDYGCFLAASLYLEWSMQGLYNGKMLS